MASQHDWELSKENVQPLREGRQMASLSAALNYDTDKSAEQEIKSMQNEFELELRTYSGSDPFDVWDRYIKWTEQYFPKGGHDGQLMMLIQRCLKEYQSDDLYKNDQRFIRIWIKFANASEDPVVVFGHMFDNGIGVTVAAFYCEWALHLERRRDVKGADAIYVEGAKRLAQPKETLKQMHDQFQHRLVNNITLQIADNSNTGMDFGETGEDRRLVLGKLKTGKKCQVGTHRTGSVSKGSAGFYKNSTTAAPKQVPGKKLAIFCDENAAPSVHLQQTNEWKSIPVRSEINRENERRPGAWTGAKVKTKSKLTSSAPIAASAPTFQIHEDEEESNPLITPRKTILINHQPLSSRKVPNYMDALSNLQPQQGVPDLNEGKPMYDKARVYNGIHEFSFEELRAARYHKKKKEREEKEKKEREEKERVEAERKKNEEMARKLEEMTEKMARMESLLLSQRMLQTNVDMLPGHRQEEEASPMNYDQTPNRTAEMSSSSQSNRSLTSAGSHRPLIFNSVNSYQNLSTTSSAGSGRQNTSSSYQNMSTSSAGRHNTSSCNTSHKLNISSAGNSFSQLQNLEHGNKTPSNPINPNPNSLNPNSFNSNSYNPNPNIFNQTATPSSLDTTSSLTNRGLSQPSPTVCTKAALAMVQKMFTASFDETNASFDTSLANQSCEPRPGGLPFQICEDRTTQLLSEIDGAVGGAVGGEVYRHQDKENQGLPSARKFDDKENAQSKGFAIFCDENENATGTARKGAGLQIFCDEPDVNSMSNLRKESGLQVKKGFGLQIYQDAMEDTEQSENSKPAVKRGLNFTPSATSLDDVEMTDRDMLTLNQADFTIEYQARDDITLAGLDKFTVLARAASTPFSAGHNQEQEMISEESSSTVAASTTEGPQQEKQHNLSPILEGSGEESKSIASSVSCCGSTTSVSTRSRHGSAPNQEPIPEDEVFDGEEGDSSMLDAENLDATSGHLIDTSCYVPSKNDQDLLSTSIMVDPKNPFDDECIANFLANLSPALPDYPNFTSYPKISPIIESSATLCLGDKYLIVEKQLGEGGYAKVYKATEQSISLDFSDDEDEEDQIDVPNYVLKVQTPPCPWEFYVSAELHRRLNGLDSSVDVKSSVVEVQKGYFYTDASILLLPYLGNGSLLDLVNKYKRERHLLAEVEPFACLLTVELLHLFEQIHAARFIHGDVKPDNFLLRNLPYLCENPTRQDVFGNQTKLVTLIDFGQSIDMDKFAEGTTFTAKVKTSGFQCIEMRTNRPWTYQTDLFGLAGTVHVVLLGLYMNVYQEQGHWRTTSSFNRKWNVSLWKEFFSEMLNIPSCRQLPNLANLRHKFEDYFLSKVTDYNNWVSAVRQLDCQS